MVFRRTRVRLRLSNSMRHKKPIRLNQSSNAQLMLQDRSLRMRLEVRPAGKRRISPVESRKAAMNKPKLVVVSAALGIGTLASIGLVKMLPYSRLRDVITDTMGLPGSLVAILIYPAGVHTGAGAPLWGWIVLAANVVFYTVAWLAVLLILRNARDRRRQRHTYRGL